MNDRRLDHLDAVRGLAMVWMTVFHFCFDLNNAGILRQDFHHNPVWTWQRTCILSLFLLCAGAGQTIAHARGQNWRQFGKRWLQIAAAAGLVSLGSWLMFPGSYIYFGVLHGMALMLLIVRLLAPWGHGFTALGVAVIATHLIAGPAVSASASSTFGLDFDARSLNWLGLITRLPVTEDYVPLLPWLGMMLLGFAGMHKYLAGGTVSADQAHMHRPPRGLVHKSLATLGRYSLSYYLLHQPVLLGLLWLAGIRS